MLSTLWTDEDIAAANAAFQKRFPAGRGMGVWTASADGTREWAGTSKGLSSLDTRHPIKNNAEYHGMELYAWQFMATAQYEDAFEHFYSAALWRESDHDQIEASNPNAGGDSGHVKAIDMCIRMARFARALWSAQINNAPYPPTSDFDLDEAWVARREAKAEQALSAAMSGLPGD
ncbi:hypothetical protein [Microbacterium sp. CIAB417]|uniref:hypothetical protein n=1 Tax=Microbacterium sp. CIAB417 TaxID=2860287 RepID=UPI001FAD6215|nr:hypothetical protein [Microbacterium sp. CIAB417]